MAEIDRMDALWYLEILAWRTRDSASEAVQPAAKPRYLRDLR